MCVFLSMTFHTYLLNALRNAPSLPKPGLRLILIAG